MRERILRAGLQLFQARGYHGVGVAEILAQSRAPKGSFYHHFPDGKAQLAVVALAWLQGEITAFLDGAARTGGGSRAMVEGLARYMAAGVRAGSLGRGSLMAVLAQEAADSPAIAAAIRDLADAIRSRLAAARTREGQAASADAFADRALALVEGASVLARIDGDPAKIERVVAAWLDDAG